MKTRDVIIILTILALLWAMGLVPNRVRKCPKCPTGLELLGLE